MVKVKIDDSKRGVIHERKYFLLSFEFQQDVIEHEATEEFIQTWITMWSGDWNSNPEDLRRHILSMVPLPIWAPPEYIDRIFLFVVMNTNRSHIVYLP